MGPLLKKGGWGLSFQKNLRLVLGPTATFCHSGVMSRGARCDILSHLN